MRSVFQVAAERTATISSSSSYSTGITAKKQVEKLIILYNCLSGFLSYFIILGTEQHAVANGSIKSYLTFKWAMIGQGVDNKEDSYSEMFQV